MCQHHTYMKRTCKARLLLIPTYVLTTIHCPWYQFIYNQVTLTRVFASEQTKIWTISHPHINSDTVDRIIWSWMNYDCDQNILVSYEISVIPNCIIFLKSTSIHYVHSILPNIFDLQCFEGKWTIMIRCHASTLVAIASEFNVGNRLHVWTSMSTQPGHSKQKNPIPSLTKISIWNWYERV